MKAAIYARKSNDDNDKNKDNKSVTRQVEQARLFAEDNGWLVSEEHIYVDDGISGVEFIERPGLLRLQDSLDEFDVVIVSELSRIGRDMTWNALVVDKLAVKDVRLFSYMERREERVDTPEARIMLTMKSYAAEFERVAAGQRTRDAAVRKFKQGYSTGGKCFGYDLVPVYATASDGSQTKSHTDFKINAGQAAVVRQIFTMYTDGYGFKSIAMTLNGDPKYAKESMKYFKGRTPKATQSKDGTWSPTTIRPMLYRKRYIGILQYGERKRVKGGGSAKGRKKGDEILELVREDLRVIAPSLWQAVQKRLEKARNTYSHLSKGARGGRTDGGRNSRFLLSGIATCACCGNNIVGTSSSEKGGENKRDYYACGHRHNRGTKACDNSGRPRAEELDGAVLASIEVNMLTENAIEYVVSRALNLLERKLKGKKDDQKDLTQEMTRLRVELKNYMDMIAQGVTSLSIGQAVVEREGMIEQLEKEIQKNAGLTKDALPGRKKLRDAARKEMKDFRGLIRNSDVAVARKAVAALLTKPDGEFMPLKIGSCETTGRGELCFSGQLATGRMFHKVGTEGRTRTDKELPPGDFESPVSTNFTTPADEEA